MPSPRSNHRKAGRTLTPFETTLSRVGPVGLTPRQWAEEISGQASRGFFDTLPSTCYILDTLPSTCYILNILPSTWFIFDPHTSAWFIFETLSSTCLIHDTTAPISGQASR